MFVTAVMVGFSQQVYSVAEEDETSAIEVCLVLQGELERSITVSVSTSDGSAIGMCYTRESAFSHYAT